MKPENAVFKDALHKDWFKLGRGEIHLAHEVFFVSETQNAQCS